MTTIRPATHDDLDQLIAISAAMHDESPRYSKLTFAAAKLRTLYGSLIHSPDGLLLVADRDGEIIGGLAALVAPHWSAVERVATDFGLFVLPAHRGGMTAVRLAKAYIAWAQDQDAQIIQLGISTGVATEETAELYRAIGLKQFSIGFEV